MLFPSFCYLKFHTFHILPYFSPHTSLLSFFATLKYSCIFTSAGSIYLALVALVPTMVFIALNVGNNIPFGGTSIIIVVGVGLETVKQIDSQLQQRHYEGFLR